MFELCLREQLSRFGSISLYELHREKEHFVFVHLNTMQRSRPCAFAVPSVSSFSTNPRHGASICALRRGVAAPFFASQAFGAPVATRANLPTTPSANNLRMEVTVVVGDGEPIESALRRFKKEVTKSGHLYELRRRRYFETNTEKRLRKAAAARRKARMARNMRRNRPTRRPNIAKTEESDEEKNGEAAETSTAPSENVIVASV